MNSLIRVHCVSNRIFGLQPQQSLACALKGIACAREGAPDIIVLPALSLTGASAGSLAANAAFLDDTRTALDRLRIETADFLGYLVVGLIIDDWSRPAPVCAILRAGKLIGFVPSAGGGSLTFHGTYSSQVLPPETVFSVGKCRFTVLSCAPEELLMHTATLCATGCDLIVCPTCAPVYAGYISETRRTLRQLTRTLGCAAALCNGGTGDSTSPHFFQGFCGIYECGDELRFASHRHADHESWGDGVCADIDTDIIAACKRGGAFVPPLAHTDVSIGKTGILRRIPQNPFLACPNRDAYVGELFALQAAALAGRLRNTGLRRMVIGISGGLDSTLALLVAARAADELGLSRAAILAVTMPGFGTTGRTYRNAVALMQSLGVDMAEISIKDACLVHFRDIGQSPEVHDVTYENAQARERTQILFDLANRVGGLVVGTGDLSEEALGWCTFGGDHLAGYNVNACLTKNMVRAAVKYAADSGLPPAYTHTEESAAAMPQPNAEALGLKHPQAGLPTTSVASPPLRGALSTVATILADILATPVSPELLPTKEGETTQRTEDILGTYDLHDFFTYYLVRYRFAPAKLFRYACIAFGAQLSPSEIKERLLLFLRRFFSAQFKRTCAPDSAAITEVNLLACRFTMPSDASAAAFVEAAERLPVLEASE